MTIFIDLGFTHSGKKAISCNVLENMFPEKNAEMNIQYGLAGRHLGRHSRMPT